MRKHRNILLMLLCVLVPLRALAAPPMAIAQCHHMHEVQVSSHHMHEVHVGGPHMQAIATPMAMQAPMHATASDTPKASATHATEHAACSGDAACCAVSLCALRAPLFIAAALQHDMHPVPVVTPLLSLTLPDIWRPPARS